MYLASDTVFFLTLAVSQHYEIGTLAVADYDIFTHAVNNISRFFTLVVNTLLRGQFIFFSCRKYIHNMIVFEWRAQLNYIDE